MSKIARDTTVRQPADHPKTLAAIDEKIAMYQQGIKAGTWHKPFIKHAKNQIRKLRAEREDLEKKEIS